MLARKRAPRAARPIPCAPPDPPGPKGRGPPVGPLCYPHWAGVPLSGPGLGVGDGNGYWRGGGAGPRRAPSKTPAWRGRYLASQGLKPKEPDLLAPTPRRGSNCTKRCELLMVTCVRVGGNEWMEGQCMGVCRPRKGTTCLEGVAGNPTMKNAGSGWAKTPGWLLGLSGIQGCWGRLTLCRRAPSPPVPPASV